MAPKRFPRNAVTVQHAAHTDSVGAHLISMRGAFASRFLRGYIFLGEYTGAQFFSTEIGGWLTFKDASYVIEIERPGETTKYIDARDPSSGTNWTRYINTIRKHYDRSRLNVMFVQEFGRVYVWSLRDIYAGEELLAEYFLSYDADDRAVRPGQPFYVVHKFVSRTVHNCQSWIKVRWLGYTHVADTWELKDDLVAALGRHVYLSFVRYILYIAPIFVLTFITVLHSPSCPFSTAPPPSPLFLTVVTLVR
jgi:hypothetical protein